MAQRASISSKIRSSKSSSEHRARLTTTLCLPLKTVIGQSSECVHITFKQVLSPVSVQHTAQGNHLRWSNRLTGDHTGTSRNKLEIERESSQTTLQSICAQHRAERGTGSPASTGRHSSRDCAQDRAERGTGSPASTGRHAPGDRAQD